MTRAPAIDGVTFKPRQGDGFELDFQIVSPALCRAVFEWLPEGWELDFHDPYLPQLSDPGGYVSVQRHHDRFRHRISNHGWQTRWIVQSPELLSVWLQLILNYPGERTPFDGPVLVGPAIISAWKDD